MVVGVIGVGVIGGALLQALKLKSIPCHGFDRFKSEYQRPKNWDDVLLSDVIFVCVPTPTIARKQDLSSLGEVLSSLNDAAYSGVVAIRSTVLPGTTNSFIEKYPSLKIVHNPEFLTAANPLNDLLEQEAVIIGSHIEEYAMTVKLVWKLISPGVSVRWRNPIVSEVAKYMHNCFLAVKVSFFNDMYDVCESAGIDYVDALGMAQMIGQIGQGHTKVPGPDGFLGFGGACFPKDTSALSAWCLAMNIPAETLNGAIAGNLRRRRTTL